MIATYDLTLHIFKNMVTNTLNLSIYTPRCFALHIRTVAFHGNRRVAKPRELIMPPRFGTVREER